MTRWRKGRYSVPMLRVVTGSIALLFALAAVPSPAAAQTTAFVGARIIDGRGAVIERGTIIVRDGKSAAVGPEGTTTVPQDAQRVDVTGATIMPGLVNAHGHLTAA